MNQTIEYLLERHSVRAYRTDSVEPEKIETILEAGRAAAHGLSRQPRKFITITQPELLRKVSASIRDSFRMMTVTDQMPQVLKQLIARAENDDADYIYAAPVFIIVTTHAEDTSGIIDTSLALGNMMIAAQALELGSCWMNQISLLIKMPPIQALLRELGIPEHETVHGTLVVGYPVGDGRGPARQNSEFINLF